jgi:hypothetical protein
MAAMPRYPFEGFGRRLFPKSLKRLRAELAEAEARLAGGAGQAEAEAEARFARGEVDELPPLRSLEEMRPLAMEVVKCKSALRARLSRRQLEAELAELRATRDRQAASLAGADMAGFNPAAVELHLLEGQIQDLESYLEYDHNWLHKPSPLQELLIFLGLLGAAFAGAAVIDYFQT